MRFVVIALLFGCQAPQDNAQCHRNQDCEGQRSCEQGRCVPRHEVPDAASPLIDAALEVDSAPDAEVDAVPDAAPDAVPDAAPDAEPDATPDQAVEPPPPPPGCVLSVPGPLDFGPVGVGEARRVELPLRNLGLGDCDLSAESEGPDFYLEAQPTLIRGGWLAPAVLVFRPTSPGPSEGTYRLGEEVSVALRGEGVAQAGAASRSFVDFGDVPIGCRSETRRLRLRECPAEHQWIGACEGFALQPVGGCDEDGQDFLVDFAPEGDAVVACALRWPTFALPLFGRGVDERAKVERFPAPQRSLDLLFVVDESASMQDEQQALSQGLERLGGLLLQQVPESRAGVISASPERGPELIGAPRLMTGPSLILDLPQRVLLGTNGAGEAPLAQTLDALTSAFDTGTACQQDAECSAFDACVEGICGGSNRGLRRPDAALAILVVTDEEDDSPQPPEFYRDRLDFEAPEAAVFVLAPLGCEAAPERLLRFDQRSGRNLDLCDFDPDALADGLLEFARRIRLGHDPDPGSVRVTVGGERVPMVIGNRYRVRY